MRILTLFALVFFVAACAESNESGHDMDNMTPGATDASEWTVLFDGTSMDAFRGYQQESMPAGWMISDDGAMVAHEPGGGNDLVTKDAFSSFELEFEWLVPEEGNSGIMFRVTEDNDYPWMSGPEYQVLDDMYHSEGEPNKNSAGSNYDVHVPMVRANKPAGEWNQARLVVDGNHVEHWLNGQKVVEYELHSDEWKAARDGSKWAQWADTYGMAESGHIAIQGDHTSVSYRNMRIRTL